MMDAVSFGNFSRACALFHLSTLLRGVKSRKYYPDWFGSGTCINDYNEPPWMSLPGYEAYYLFDTASECCNIWFPAQSITECPAAPSALTEILGTFYPDWYGAGTCNGDDNYPSWMTLPGYPRDYLLSAANCCQRWFPLDDDCPIGFGGRGFVAAPPHGTTYIPMTLEAWKQMSFSGDFKQEATGLTLHGSGHRQGNMVQSKEWFNLLGSTSRFKWKPNHDGYSEWSVGVRGLPSIGLFSTSHSRQSGWIGASNGIGGLTTWLPSGGVPTVVSSANWYYTRITIGTDGSFETVTCTENYDDQPSSSCIMSPIVKTLSDSEKSIAEMGIFQAQFNDNDAGTSASMTLLEVTTTADAVPPPQEVSSYVYNFDARTEIPFNMVSDSSTGCVWEIDESSDAAGGGGSGRSLKCTAVGQTPQNNCKLALTVVDASAITFSVRTEAVNSDASMYFRIGNVDYWETNAGDSKWRTFTYPVIGQGEQVITWHASPPTYYAPNQESIWLDNIRVSYGKGSESAICPTDSVCDTIEELMDYGIMQKMPLRDSELYTPPDPSTVADFEMTVTDMMAGTCTGQLPSSISSSYSMELFVDAENSKAYCVLASTADNNGDGVVDSPWGTVVVNYDANAKDLSIDVTHPWSDLHTANQGIAVFKGTNARSFVLSGSHRHANSEPSPCQSNYEIADAAHNDGTFQSSVAAILAYYVSRGLDHTSIQFHGMDTTTCEGVDAYMTHGSEDAPHPSDKVHRLRVALEVALGDGSKTLTVPGDSPYCHLKGSQNVQGRLLNGVSRESVCSEAATEYSGRFIHVDQKISLRDPGNALYDEWSTAINFMLTN